MTNLEGKIQQLEEYVKARDLAVPGKWYACGCRYTMISRELNDVETEDILEVCNHYQNEIQAEHNKRFICLAANKSSQVASDLVTALRALEFYATDPYVFDEADDDTEMLSPSKPWRNFSGKRARQAIAEIVGKR